MNDLFSEILIPRKQTMGNMMIKVFLILATVFCFFVGLMIPIFLLVGVGMIFLDSWLIPRQSTEFEYSYVNGDLDIDKIYAKKSRKHIVTYHIHDAEIIAPATSSSLDGYQNLPMEDYTDGTPEGRKKALVFVASNKDARKRVYILPNEHMWNDIRMRSGSKFHAN